MPETPEDYKVIPGDITSDEKSIFIWLDILGFSDLVEQDSNYGEVYNMLLYFQDLFQQGSGYACYIISDGIVLQIPKLKRLGVNGICEIFTDIVKRQFDFIIEKGEFIRGGIALGTKYTPKNKDEKDNADAGNFISNGLAKAVKVEEKYVSWPVVGTSKKHLDEIIKHLPGCSKDEAFGLCRAFNNSGEELFFLDINIRNAEEKIRYYELLKEKIEMYRREPDKAGPLNKYLWLLRHLTCTVNLNRGNKRSRSNFLKIFARRA